MTEKIKILTCDSGLGGLSVTAELVEKIKTQGQFEEAEISFFNCRPSNDSAYDSLGSNESRAKVFSKSLYAMYEKFQPDIIMIACNTLSAIYEMCEFSKSPPVAVIGIIEDGVDEIFNSLLGNPAIEMIMFGTPTTVSSGMHKNILTAWGIDPERLHYQDCLNLPSAIVHGAESDEIKNMIENFMKSGVSKTKRKSFGISLLCTHFAYSLSIFSEVARTFKNFSGDIINPNSALVDSFLRKYKPNKAANPKISIKCYTHTTISLEMRQEIFPYLKKISPDTADALLNIVDTPDMF